MKYEYMKESEQMLQYFQFPKFLLKLRISQTAKFLYMILYDRARISRKNSWIDKYGNVYLIFPILFCHKKQGYGDPGHGKDKPHCYPAKQPLYREVLQLHFASPPVH